MAALHPMAHGFRTALRRPALVLAEFTWRLAFVVAASALVVGILTVYLENLRVSDSDAMALRSGIWLLVLDALVRIFRESYPQLVRASMVLIPALGFLWMLTVALGRGAVLRPLLVAPGQRWLAPLMGLNFLRVALGLAAVLAFYGSGILAWEAAATPDGDRLPQTFVRVFVSLVVLVSLVWTALAWFLWLAAIPAAAGQETFSAVARAARVWRANLRHFLFAGLVFSLIRGVAFAFVVMLLFALSLQAGEAPRTAALLAAVLVPAYMLAASWLRVARLATFAAIHEGAATNTWDRPSSAVHASAARQAAQAAPDRQPAP